MLSVDQVLQVIAEKIAPIPPQQLSLSAAHGAVLAQDLRMSHDSPPFDRALVDGFALRHEDATPGRELAVVARIDAGGIPFSGTLAPGQCAAINTGAPIPVGADAVLMVEHSRPFTRGHEQFITVNQSLKPGSGLQKKAADAHAGSVVLQQGTKLSPTHLALAAAAGIGSPLVRRPTAAILTTGDELVEPQSASAEGAPPIAQLAPGQIWNSNRPMLAALAAHAGCHVLDLGTCRDEEPLIREMLLRGFQQSDLLIVSGGMSMGTRDWVPLLLKDLGVELHVEKVLIKPGKPFILGTWNHQGRQKTVAGLPGNPVSAFVTFQRFVREVIARLTAQQAPALSIIPVQSATATPANGDREFYQPCTLRHEGPTLVAQVLPWKGSADLFTLARADALLIRPANAPALAPGQTAPALLCN